MFFVSPLRTFIIFHLLHMEIFVRSKVIIFMWIIYILIMLINIDIHFLRLYNIFFKDNISRVIISHTSLALLIIIHKIHSLSGIIRNCSLRLVFNERPAQLSIVGQFTIVYCLSFGFFFASFKPVRTVKGNLRWGAINHWFFHDIFDGNLLRLVSFKIRKSFIEICGCSRAASEEI